jgi:DNA-binding PadR family transcriptional regulator
MGKQFWGFAGAYPWAAFAFGRRGRLFEAGEIRLALLSLLGEGPKHGYQLMKEMQERSSGMYRASAGSVYPTLQQLEDEELIESDQHGGKRTYRLTQAGKKELEKEAASVHDIWERAEGCEGWGEFPGPEALMMYYGPLAAVVKAGVKASSRMAGDPAGADRVREILDRARRDLDQL